MGKRRLPLFLLALVAVGVTGLAILSYSTRVFKSLEGSTIDARFSVRGDQPVPKDVIIVKVDDATFRDLNKQWPFPRAYHGRVVKRIVEQDPAVVAVDLQLSESSYLGQNDDYTLVFRAQATHHKVVFASTEVNEQGHINFLNFGSASTKLLKMMGVSAASALIPPDSNGVLRRMAYAVNGLPTLGIVGAEIATGKEIPRSAFPKTTTYVDYVGPGGRIPSISYSRVYGCKDCPPLPPNFFTGKTVVIGGTAPSLQDLHPTSTDSLMSGPESQANAILTAERGFPLTGARGWVNIALILLLGLAVPLISLRFGPLVMTGVALVLGIALAVGAQLAFNSGKVIAFVYPLGALIFSFGGSLAVKVVSEAFERTRTRDLFSRFVPEDVVDEVLASADGLRLGGVQREGTVMFTDLRGFTSMAESLTPARVIDTLNHYLGEMSDAILNHGGTLVAYMGDGIMAVFGAPLQQDDHADRALAAAREMLDVRLPRFNAWLRSESLSEGFKMGIGLNSGSVMSGHVGSERRVEYTAVGDTTNTAARIEALTKGTDHMLYLAESVKDALTTPVDDLEFVKDTDIRGRVEKIRLWSLTSARHTPPAPVEAEEIRS